MYGPCASSSLSSAFLIVYDVVPALPGVGVITTSSVPSGRFVNSTSCDSFPFTTIGAISFPSLSVAGFPFSSSRVYVIVLIPLSGSVAFASTVIEFVDSSTSGVDSGAVLST